VGVPASEVGYTIATTRRETTKFIRTCGGIGEKKETISLGLQSLTCLYLVSLAARTLSNKLFFHVLKILRESVSKSRFTSFTILVLVW